MNRGSGFVEGTNMAGGVGKGLLAIDLAEIRSPPLTATELPSNDCLSR